MIQNKNLGKQELNRLIKFKNKQTMILLDGK